jgi:hypothetical protein
MVEKVHGKDFSQVQTANPCTIEDVAALQKIILSNLLPITHELQSMLKRPKNHVIAIGGPYSPFKMASLAIGENRFTKDQVWNALNELVGYSDVELSGFPEPTMLIPRLTLIYTVMGYFGIDRVDYCETTGSTLGILVSPQFWGIAIPAK